MRCRSANPQTHPWLLESLENVSDRPGGEGVVIDTEVIDPPLEQGIRPLALSDITLCLREEGMERDGCAVYRLAIHVERPGVSAQGDGHVRPAPWLERGRLEPSGALVAPTGRHFK